MILDLEGDTRLRRRYWVKNMILGLEGDTRFIKRY